MSIIDDQTPIILDRLHKMASYFQKMFKTKFAKYGWIKISVKPTVLVNFHKFHFFSRREGVDKDK